MYFRSLPSIVTLVTLIVAGPVTARAVDINVGNSTELQMALNTAATNATDDTIFLDPVTFSTTDNGSAAFLYQPGFDAGGLTLTGAGVGQTILDGDANTRILSILDDNSSGEINISGITFQNGNTNSGSGAGLQIETSGSSNLAVSVTHCEFNNNINSASIGGGASISNLNQGIVFNANSLVENQSATQGGGAFFSVEAGDVAITNNIFYLNEATNNGGGFFLTSSQTNLNNIVNNTVFTNSAGAPGGGIAVNTSASGIANLFNNIIFGNTVSATPDDVLFDGATGATRNLFFNDLTAFTNDTLGTVSQGNNPNTDPGLIDPDGGNFQLPAGSTLIDVGGDTTSGLPDEDFLDHPRIIGPNPDLGAIEAFPLLQPSPTQMDFGAVPLAQSSAQTLTLANNGTYPLDIFGFGVSGSGAFTMDFNGGGEPCGSQNPVIAPGESCTLVVTFTPFTGDAVTATLLFTSNDPERPSVAVILTGSTPQGGGGCALEKQPTARGLGWIFLLFTASLIPAILWKRCSITV